MARPARRSRPRAIGTGVAVAVALLLAACTGASTKGSGPPTPSADWRATRNASGTCTLSGKAVPSCGVLWGIAAKPPTPARITQVEQVLGRPVDFVYRYHDVNDVVPDDAERAWVAQGKLLHIAIAARDFSNQIRGDITWAEIASGKYDASLKAQAVGIASLQEPVFVTFEQEASQKRKLSALGSPDDFRAAWRHLHDLYQQAGAKNAVWTWVMTGAEENLTSAGQLWPGNQYVDWISWNVYNQSGCASDRITLTKLVSFKDKMLVFYDWLLSKGRGLGIDTNKPIMISETGSAQYSDDPSASAAWYAAIPSVLQEYPQIKAVGLWDSIDGTCKYDFTDVPDIATGARTAGLNPYLDLHGALTNAG
jgi:hypothetical protein